MSTVQSIFGPLNCIACSAGRPDSQYGHSSIGKEALLLNDTPTDRSLTPMADYSSPSASRFDGWSGSDAAIASGLLSVSRESFSGIE